MTTPAWSVEVYGYSPEIGGWSHGHAAREEVSKRQPRNAIAELQVRAVRRLASRRRNEAEISGG